MGTSAPWHQLDVWKLHTNFNIWYPSGYYNAAGINSRRNDNKLYVIYYAGRNKADVGRPQE